MKVLMIVRDTFFVSPGGDTVQVIKTAQYIRNLDFDVDIELSGNKNINYSTYDIIHFFNIIRPDDILPHLNSNLPYVISTIFVDYTEYEKNARTGITGLLFKMFNPGQIEYLKSLARLVIKGDKIKSAYYLFFGYTRSIKKSIQKVSYLLPNSHSEYNRFKKLFKHDIPYQKVVNAIEPSLFNYNVEPNNDYNNHVLCVARIEGLKNQLNIIKAINETDLKLTIIGKPALNQISYYKACLKEAEKNPNIQFINHLSHEQLVPIYKAAKVHVLASWFETTGLSSLEAGAMGCNIVITKKGDTEEYYKDMAYYCEPDDVQSIKLSILSAFNNPAQTNLQDYIRNNYTWEKTASQTVEIYNKIMQLYYTKSL